MRQNRSSIHQRFIRWRRKGIWEKRPERRKSTGQDFPARYCYLEALSFLHLTADHRSDGIRRILLHLCCGGV